MNKFNISHVLFSASLVIREREKWKINNNFLWFAWLAYKQFWYRYEIYISPIVHDIMMRSCKTQFRISFNTVLILFS
jgi:succinate-acetate transporter protein